MVYLYKIIPFKSTLTRCDSVGDEAPSSSLRTQTVRKWMDGSGPRGSPDQNSQWWREQQQYRLHPTRLFRRHERNGRGNYISAFVLGSLMYFMLLARGPAVADAKVTPNGAIVWDGNGWIPLVDDDSDHVPPPPKTDSWKRPETTMFVGVSSFRDKRCPQTLVNYFTKAKHPERLTVAVVQQNDHDDVDCVTEYCNRMNQKEGPSCPYFNNIKTLRVEAKNAAGPCYGRHLQSYMLRDEEFCMQTDSHMDVVQDWDAKLLDMWGRVNNEYGILTTYVHRIENLRDGSEKHQEVPHLCQMYFTDGNHPRYVQAKLVKNLPRPKLTTSWAAGLSVAKCHAWKAAPYDPGLRKVFDGEEFSMHARLWTRGYDTYTPDKSLVGHDYNKVTDGPPPSSWIQNFMRPGTKDRAYQRMFTLLGMPGKVDTPEMWESIGKYGLGTKRSLEQYQQFIGVNLSTLEVMGSRCGTLRHVPFEESWPPTENNLAGPYWDRRIQRKGVHAVDYIPPYNSKYSRARVGPGFSSIHRQSRPKSTEDRFGVGTFFAFLLVFAAIGGCALGCANFLSDDNDTSSMSASRRRSAGRIGGRASRQARPRGRPQWSRRAEGTKGEV